MKMTFNKVLDIIIQLGFDEEDARMILVRLEELELLNIKKEGKQK